MIAVQDIVDVIQKHATPDELADLVDGLVPALSKVPIAALLRLGEAVAKAASGGTELGAMQAAVAAADAAADVVEAETLASQKPKT